MSTSRDGIVKRALQIVEVIGTLEPKLGEFDMTEYVHLVDDPDREGHWCGTPSCMAGWGIWISEGRRVDASGRAVCSRIGGVGPYATAWLLRGDAEWRPDGYSEYDDYSEIEGATAEEREFQLVRDELFRGAYGSASNEGLTRKQAIDTLMHFARTGEVDWTINREN